MTTWRDKRRFSAAGDHWHPSCYKRGPIFYLLELFKCPFGELQSRITSMEIIIEPVTDWLISPKQYPWFISVSTQWTYLSVLFNFSRRRSRYFNAPTTNKVIHHQQQQHGFLQRRSIDLLSSCEFRKEQINRIFILFSTFNELMVPPPAPDHHTRSSFLFRSYPMEKWATFESSQWFDLADANDGSGFKWKMCSRPAPLPRLRFSVFAE